MTSSVFLAVVLSRTLGTSEVQCSTLLDVIKAGRHQAKCGSSFIFTFYFYFSGDLGNWLQFPLLIIYSPSGHMNPIAISSGFPEPGLPLSPPLTHAPSAHSCPCPACLSPCCSVGDSLDPEQAALMGHLPSTYAMVREWDQNKETNKAISTALCSRKERRLHVAKNGGTLEARVQLLGVC